MNDPNEQNCWETLAKLQIDKALEAYEVAGMAIENGKLISAVNRLYYAAFYAASGLLQIRGKAFAKHSAVRAALHRDLVHPGDIPAEFGELFDRLFKDRQDGDYKPETKFDRTEITNLFEETKKFLSFVKENIFKK